MPLYRPSELAAFLNSLGVRPKRALSQNFLVDGNVLKKICQLAEVTAGDTVIEIGPGPGVLTERLLELGCKVIAIEKDTTFARALRRLGQLEVVEGDALDVDFAKLAEKPVKIIANIPYNITSALLERIVKARSFSSATLMVQEEVARKMSAKPNTKDFGLLSLFLQFHAEVLFGFSVPPRCFYPSPKVASAVVRLNCKEPQSIDEEAFFKTIERAFCHRRKTLKASLNDVYPKEKIANALEKMHKDPMTRPEELSLEEWVEFFYSITEVPLF